jgi:cytochrome c peroxidase
MNKPFLLIIATILVVFASLSFKNVDNPSKYVANYHDKLTDFDKQQAILLSQIESKNLSLPNDIVAIKQQIEIARNKLKGIDFWLRYLEPISYKKINGPLPVEWETEVFEKFEKPYKRVGAGLTLAELYLDETVLSKDTLAQLIQASMSATPTFRADSITSQLGNYHHFFLCNRLFLLNLAAIYTTGFECPDTTRIIPELHTMLANVKDIYHAYSESFPAKPLTENYLELYENAIKFTEKQPSNFTEFDHFTFIKNYINPLFAINQKLINEYKVRSKSTNDFTLNNDAFSLFDKNLFEGQNTKGLYSPIEDEQILAEIDKAGKLLFYDPILSGNNMRSCVSCHKSNEYFTDTSATTALQYDRQNFLQRNTPTLINATFNHLLMLDGKHISLQNQAKDVITNATELGSNEKELLKKVLSCPDYKKSFSKFLKYTPEETEITFGHLVAAITLYYAKFSQFYAPFDESMNENKQIDESAKKGFNLFMSKAQCATCHFVPHFNGVKPPYVGSEFEILGVPNDANFSKISEDKGRFNINQAAETASAFRTGSIRNAGHTKPYMHNGVFKTLEQVLDFYDAGGGVGRGLVVKNQTLSSDSLRLSKAEKDALLAFMKSLNENVKFENAPEKLPESKDKTLNSRKIGGEY